MSTACEIKDRKRLTKQVVFKVNQKKKSADKQAHLFQKVFASVMHRRKNQFSTLESPHLNQQIQDIDPKNYHQYHSSVSTPSTRIPLALERKKYQALKGKIEQAMGGVGKGEYSSMRELFREKQLILTELLNEFSGELEKQCKQKGDILKFLWNTMINLVETISENVSISMKQKEKYELQNNLRSHKQYQQLLEGYQKKQTQLNQKCKIQRVTINSLVYELRFKRKQVNKLYRNQKLLINKLNEFKSDNLNLQSSYVDLMCSLRDVPPEKVQMLLKVREQINKNKQKKFKVNTSKKNARNQIKAQLSNDKIEELQNLYDQIKQIANSDGGPQLISSLIEASIQNFGLKNDDALMKDQYVVSVPQNIPKMNVETQVTEYDLRDKSKINCPIQYGYIERLTAQLINHKDTQTYCQYPKKKLLINASTETDIVILNASVSSKFNIIRTCSESFLNQIANPQPKLKQIASYSMVEKRHKKHNSDANLFRKSYEKSSGIIELQDFIEEKDDSSQSSGSISDIDSKSPQIKHSTNLKLKKSATRMINFFAKQRYNSTVSVSSANVPNNFHSSDNYDPIPNNLKKTSFAPSATQNLQSLVPRNRKKTQKSKQVSEQKLLKKQSSRPSSKKQQNIIGKFKKTREQFIPISFLQKAPCYNVEINAQKEQQINNLFSSNDYTQIQLSESELKQELLEKDSGQIDMDRLKSYDPNFINQYFQDSKAHSRQSSGHSMPRSNKQKRGSVKYDDENELLLNLCRHNKHKAHKKLKQKIAIYKYQDQFTCVRDKIQFVARDVKTLVVNKSSLLKKVINSKNIKNTYKILMMTFSKAYDSYNKGVLKGNLIYPLFQSFALVYGAINNNEIYKKMINFIAALTVCRQNTILRFFLFFLGLDSVSPYSQKVTISQVYLCLKLLEKISVDGKVTLNIESIYTDTTRIKDQLILILKQENIPEVLSQSIESRVQKQLQNSCLFKNSSGENSHLKLNIYNIILLIIQQVIKCKNALREAFTPIFIKYQQFTSHKKIPVYLLEVLLSDWQPCKMNNAKLKSLIDVITLDGKRQTVTVEQFCSILFQCNLVNIDQLQQKCDFIYRRNWKIPSIYLQAIKKKVHFNMFESVLQKREIQMFLRISSESEEPMAIQKIKRIIFEKQYQKRVQSLASTILGSDLTEILCLRPSEVILE